MVLCVIIFYPYNLFLTMNYWCFTMVMLTMKLMMFWSVTELVSCVEGFPALQYISRTCRGNLVVGEWQTWHNLQPMKTACDPYPYQPTVTIEIDVTINILVGLHKWNSRKTETGAGMETGMETGLVHETSFSLAYYYIGIHKSTEWVWHACSSYRATVNILEVDHSEAAGN